MITEATADYVWRGEGGPILLERTCHACPEQYDAFTEDGQQAGYLRLRHGYFTADLIACDGPCVYEARPDGDGIFAGPTERDVHLDKACAGIAKALIQAKTLRRAIDQNARGLFRVFDEGATLAELEEFIADARRCGTYDDAHPRVTVNRYGEIIGAVCVTTREPAESDATGASR